MDKEQGIFYRGSAYENVFVFQVPEFFLNWSATEKKTINTFSVALAYNGSSIR